MRSWLALSIFLLCCAGSTVHAEDALNIGPLRFGMSIEEAGREVPHTAWRNLRKSKYSGTVTAIRAADPFDLAGMPFLAEIYEQKLGEYKLRYVRQWSAEDARDCSSAAAKVIGLLEPLFGSFAPVARVDIVKVGNSSSMSVRSEAYGHKPFYGRGDPSHAFVQTGARIARERPVELEVRAEYERLDQRRCSLELTATRAPLPRAPEVYPFSPQSIVGTASVSSRNRDLRKLRDLPPDGLTMSFNCKVRRADGNVDFCKPVREEDKKIEDPFVVASFQAMAITLDVKGLDPDDPLELDVQIPITLNRSNLRTPDFGGSCKLDAAKVPWIHEPKQFAGDYPESARKQKLSAQIDVGCEIQTDGSLICALAPGASEPPNADLLERALLIVERGDVSREVEGQSMVGCLLRHSVTFPKPGS